LFAAFKCSFGSRFSFFWCGRILVFYLDFLEALVDVGFKFVADVVSSSECVCSGGYGEFARDDPRDFSSLPPFCVVE
jgi:hypothetical protein